MNIGFDATAILGKDSINRGIGNYTKNQFNYLIKNYPNYTFYCLNFYDCSIIGEFLDKANNLVEERIYSGKNNVLLTEKYNEVYGDIIRKFLKKHDINIFYITCPFEYDRCCYKREWFLDVIVYATVYDIIPYIFKDRYLQDSNLLDMYIQRIDMLRWVDKCLAISQSAKYDIIHYFGFDSQKIDVIGGAPDKKFRKLDITLEEKNRVLKKFEVQGKYIICTGGDDDRKNISYLIQAFAKMKEEFIKEYQLVIVCKIQEISKNRYLDLAKTSGLEDGKIVFTNFVTDEELVFLCNCASLMAFVSQYEGFGLPVVEAYACEIPVLTSNNSSLIEVAGTAAFMVNPFDIDSICQGLEEALSCKDYNERIKRGQKLIQKCFNWDKVADLTEKSFFKQDKRDKRKVKKLAIFTPLPPIESGISDFSVDIVRELAKKIDKIDIFIENYQINEKFPENVEVFHHSKFRPQYDEILYEMGNSDYHTYMLEYIMTFPGIVELHDCDMKGLVSYLGGYKDGERDTLIRNLLAYDLTTNELNSIINSQNIISTIGENLDINGFVTYYAKKIITHSEYGKNRLLKKNIGHEVICILLYAIDNGYIDKNKSRNLLKLNANDIIIASYGMVATTKRVKEIIQALAKLKKAGYVFKFIFVGKLFPEIKDIFYELLNKNNLNKDVKVTGFVSLEEFNLYLDASDICVNLRYPYHGENSGVLMRSLSKGKCILVNRIGAFDEIPDLACVKLPSAHGLMEVEEIENIYLALKNLLDNPYLIQEYGKEARRYFEENLNLNKLISKYLSVLEDDCIRSINEEWIRKFVNEEITKKSYTEEEISNLVLTLKYIKN